MNLIYALFLGLLQGATEFLPVSSSGHLVVAGDFFQISQASLTFDVSLHMGTLLAVVVYFREDLVAMITAVCCRDRQSDQDQTNRNMALLICVATVPAVIAGLLLEDMVETAFRHPALVAVNLVVFGWLLLWADKRGTQSRDLHSLGLKDALFVGVAQAIAIIPGVSRSGITMTAGLFRTLDRVSVARFSFLMSVPVIAGAGMLNMIKIIGQGMDGGQIAFYLTGFVVSAVSGYIFISFLMKFIQTKSFAVFAYYRFALAGVIVLKLTFW